MTNQQQNILLTYLATQGIRATVMVKNEKYDIQKDIDNKYNKLNDLTIELKELKEIKDEDKRVLQEAVEIQRLFKEEKKDDPEQLILLKDNIKLKQKEYDKSILYVKKFKGDIDSLKRKIAELEILQKQIEEVNIEFGEDIVNETGIKCEKCGNLEAYPQLNPLASQIYDDHSLYNLCDDCINDLAEEV